MDRRWLGRTVLAAVCVGLVAAAAGRLSGLGATLGLPLFLGLQPFAMAWAREAPLRTGRVYGASAAAAVVGAVLQYAVA